MTHRLPSHGTARLVTRFTEIRIPEIRKKPEIRNPKRASRRAVPEAGAPNSRTWNPELCFATGRDGAWRSVLALVLLAAALAGCGQRNKSDHVELVMGSGTPTPATTFELRFESVMVKGDQVGQPATNSPLVIRPRLAGTVHLVEHAQRRVHAHGTACPGHQVSNWRCCRDCAARTDNHPARPCTGP